MSESISVTVPTARFVGKQLTILNVDGSTLEGERIDWKNIYLDINDIIQGPTRTVIVDMFHDKTNHHIYLKTMQRLEKREFEEIFGFRVGEFVAGRIIRVDDKCLSFY